jgi:hypothetical protein
MDWVERQSDTGMAMEVTPEKARVLDKARDEGLPVVEKEAARGQVPLDPIRFTPVRSPGIYEAEFARKDSDLVFHFWPYGYHEADRNSRPTPRFVPKFEHYMRILAVAEFGLVGGGSPAFHEDKDMGAWCMTVPGWGEKQFFHEVAVKFCEKLHHALGGS